MISSEGLIFIYHFKALDAKSKPQTIEDFIVENYMMWFGIGKVCQVVRASVRMISGILVVGHF